MIQSKMDRIRGLSRLGQWAPATYWTAASLAASVASSHGWYVRATDGWSGDRGPLSTAGAQGLLRRFEGEIAVQPFARALVSGAFWLSGGGVLIEMVAGESYGLFRGGERGVRVLFSGTSIVWTDADEARLLPRSQVEHAASEIAGAIGALGNVIKTGDLVEWIVDEDEVLTFVDLKSMGSEFLTFRHDAQPEEYWVGTPRRGKPAAVWSTTNYSSRWNCPVTRRRRCCVAMVRPCHI